MSNRSGYSKQIALGGLLCAVALLFMFMAGVLPLPFFFVMMSGVVIGIITRENGLKLGFSAYVAVGLLSFFLVPNVMMAVQFMLFEGVWPVFKGRVERIEKKSRRWTVKSVIFAVSAATSLVFSLFVFASPAVLERMESWGIWWALSFTWGINALLCFNYDILVLGGFLQDYETRLRPKFIRS